MLNVLKFDNKKFIKTLKIFLDKRKSVQKNQTTIVTKIIKNVKNEKPELIYFDGFPPLFGVKLYKNAKHNTKSIIGVVIAQSVYRTVFISL